jgi:hypothetical protein
MDRLLKLLRRLRDGGNTVLVVEHDPDAKLQSYANPAVLVGAGDIASCTSTSLWIRPSQRLTMRSARRAMPSRCETSRSSGKIAFVVVLVVIGAALARRIAYGEAAGSCAVSCAGLLGLIILIAVVLVGIGILLGATAPQ